MTCFKTKENKYHLLCSVLPQCVCRVGMTRKRAATFAQTLSTLVPWLLWKCSLICPFVAPLLLQHSSPQQEHINGKSNPILVIICTWLTLQTWQFPDFSPDQGARAGLHPAARSASLGTSYLDKATAEPGGLTAPRALCYEALRTLQHCRARHWVPPALREQQGNVPIPALPAVLLLVFLPRGTASTQWACKFLHPGSALCCSERCLGLRGTRSPGYLRVPWLRGSGTATCPGLHWDLCHLLLILTRHCAAGKNIGGNQRWFFSCRHPVIS